jgi:erythromycin esterase-like protein
MADEAIGTLAREAARPLAGTPDDPAPDDLAPLLALVGDARFVLIGEASHGTHEFYALRAALTRRLIEEHGFGAVAVEADWPDAYRVNCFVRGGDGDRTPEDALGDFTRFPTWMWRNTVVRDFVGWLRAHNAARPEGAPRVGFYGLDLYSLRASLDAVVRSLDKLDPEAARRARERYGCFDHFGRDPQSYGMAVGYGAAESCEQAVVEQLLEVRRTAEELSRRAGAATGHGAFGEGEAFGEDEAFYVEQNARLAVNAEQYYRAMFRGRASSWNLRDCHMAETLDALVGHLARRGDRPKVVVWAHNSHLGDARATDMASWGELNLGQLVRERHGAAAVSVGLSTYAGTVTAADDWDLPPETMRVRPGLPGSYEALFHDVAARAGPAFLLTLRDEGAASARVLETLRRPRLQRAIGVVYRPDTERQSHYVNARLADQFDALLHLDETRALRPLERTAGVDDGEPPDTFPTSL